MLTNCYLSDHPLTAPKSKEHLIPASLGGVTVSTDILCGPCNNGLASRIDYALFQQIGYIYSLVVQARSNTPSDALTISYHVDGTRIEHRGELHPRMPVTIQLGDMKPIRLVTDKADAIPAVRKKLIQLQGRFPKMDVESTIDKLVIKEFPDALHYFTNGYSPTLSMVGGPDFFRAIKKIALNFYLHYGGEIEYVIDVIQQVKENKPAPRKISKFYYPTVAPIHQLGPEEISHVVKLVGNPEWGVLYCYVELFNVHNAIILLNDQYKGPPIDIHYCYDVLWRTRIEKPVALPFKNRAHVTDYFLVSSITEPLAAAAYKRTRDILYNRMRAKGIIK